MMPVIRFALPGLELTLPSYGVFAVLAFIAGAVLFRRALRQAGFPVRIVRIAIGITVVGFLAGARLLNLFVHPEAFQSGFALWSLDLANFSLYGGILAVALNLLALIWIGRLDGWKFLDATVVPFTIAFAFARTGCFLNGCCTGRMTASPLGMPFPAALTAARQLARLTGSSIPIQLGQYPTQLYELALALIGLLAITWLRRRRTLPTGAAFLIDAVWFTAMRWAILPLRDYPYQPVVTGIAYPILYATIIITSIFLLIRRQTAARPVADQTAQGTNPE